MVKHKTVVDDPIIFITSINLTKNKCKNKQRWKYIQTQMNAHWIKLGEM